MLALHHHKREGQKPGLSFIITGHGKQCARHDGRVQASQRQHMQQRHGSMTGEKCERNSNATIMERRRGSQPGLSFFITGRGEHDDITVSSRRHDGTHRGTGKNKKEEKMAAGPQF